MTIAIISHPDCALHDAGADHVERPDRVRVVQEALERYSFQEPVVFHQAPIVTTEQLMRVHDKAYVDWIISIAPKKELIGIDEDTFMSPFTLNAAFRAAGAVVFAVDLVMQQQVRAAFCNIRPPGHHAEREKAMGFCFFNNVAVGVAYAMEYYGISRVAIIDFDVHHGNGTQNIFQRDKRVMLCSSFEHPLYPGYEPEMDSDHILNIPLKAGTAGDVFREKIQIALLDPIAAFQPELIFFSAGFDAHAKDTISNVSLTESDYVWLTTEVANIAKKHSGGKMISVLEGGYHLDALAQCVPAHVNAMVC